MCSPPYDGGMLALLALFGPKQGMRIPLDGRLSIGRGTTVDVQFFDGKISREHCVFELAGTTARVRDLGSQNGTYVNGTRIEGDRALAVGDEIAIGDTVLLLSGEGIDISGARYGAGTVLISGKPQGDPAARTLPPSPRATALAELTTGLMGTASEEIAAQLVVAAVGKALVPRRATVLLQAPGDPRLVPLATQGQAAVTEISRTLLAKAAAQGQGLLVEDALESRDLEGVRSVIDQRLGSLLVVPFGPADARGFLHVEREASQPFTLDDLAWLSTVGHVCSLRFSPAPTAPTVSLRMPVGDSPAFREALRLAEAAARVDSTVLLEGETGTGKEEIARLIHDRSRRAKGPFIVINCGAIPENLAESEFFGHEKGAFTGAIATRLGAFEAAGGGTLFLDEIGDLPSALQVKLLRVLQERVVVRVGSTVARPVDVRLLVASHRTLSAEVKEGRFREDLFFRLNVIAVGLPPLRNRREDIPALATALLARVSARLGVRTPAIAEEALACLARWDFPGNVRELFNVLERMVVLRDPRDATPLDADDVQAALGKELAISPAATPDDPDETLAVAVARLERTRIEAALRRARGVKSQAVKILGISRPTLDKKIAELGIDLWA